MSSYRKSMNATKPGNLIVLEQTFLGPVTMTKVLSRVSPGTSEELFRVPVGYKKAVEKSYDEKMKETLDRIKQPPASSKSNP
jgi:hypothetical protein